MPCYLSEWWQYPCYKGRRWACSRSAGGAFLVRQPRFERATRSLATFVRLLRSLRSLAPQRAASLRSLCSLAPFTGSLTHFAHPIVVQLKFMNICSHCDRVSQEQTRFWSSLETRPQSLETRAPPQEHGCFSPTLAHYGTTALSFSRLGPLNVKNGIQSVQSSRRRANIDDNS